MHQIIGQRCRTGIGAVICHGKQLIELLETDVSGGTSRSSVRPNSARERVSASFLTETSTCSSSMKVTTMPLTMANA